MSDRGEDRQRPPSTQGHLLTQSRPDVVLRSPRALGVTNGRPVVVVLGMHRSGTSLLSNVLHYLGVDMADMTDHISPKNAGGFWERPELTAIHDEILAAIDRPIGRASHVLPFPPAWWRRKEVQALKPKLVAYLEAELAKSANLWGFKDPRTCRLLPLWWEVFRELRLRPLYVHAVRNPAEASVSMSQKSGVRKMSAANSELMWLSYNYDVARFVTAEHPTIMVDYADWFSHGAGLASRLAEQLGIGDDLTPEDIADCVKSIVRGEFRHQVDGTEGVTSQIPLASMLYEALSDGNSDSESDVRALRGQLRLADLFFRSLAPIVDELDQTAQAQAPSLAGQLAEMEKDAKLLSEKLDEARIRSGQSAKAHEEAQQRILAQGEELQALRRRLSRRTGLAVAAPAVFEWPVDPSSYAIDSELTRVDKDGISGSISIGRRRDIVPIIEIRVDGRVVMAMACTSTPREGEAFDGGEWKFAVPWKAFAPDHAGGQAVVQIAGLQHVVGKADIPLDLRRYHVAPAALAAELIGGTRAEAEEYQRWIVANEPAGDIELARAYSQKTAAAWPRITVFIHGKGKHRDAFSTTIDSLQAQVYDNWEAICIGAPNAIVDIDQRVRAAGPAEIAELLSGLADDALLSFVEASDQLAPTALLLLAVAANDAGEFALIYSDEDRIDGDTGLRALPHFKADWSADLALVQDYGSRLALVQRKRITSLDDLDHGRVYEITLRAALAGQEPVIHLPYVLYHRSATQADDPKALKSAVQSLLADAPKSISGAEMTTLPDDRWSIDWPLPSPAPRVSLIVPTRDRADLLRVCVEGFLNETDYPSLEVLIADNESRENETLSYLAKVSSHPRVRVIACPGAFNFSTINNLAATHATGSLIGLMNNDLKVIDSDWLRRMVTFAVRPDIGIVGAKLLHGDETIQHAGVTLGIGIASHLYKTSPPDAPGRNGRLIYPQDLSAVTAACLLMRREVWDKVGGLDEGFPVAYNDIDMCLKVRAAGYRILWSPDVLVHHLESQSRGQDVTPEKRARLERDKARLIKRWGDQLSRDPFHSPNLSDRHVDARLAFPSRISPPWRSAASNKSERTT